MPLLDTTLQVAQKLNIPRSHIYIIELPPQATDGKPSPKGFKTIDDLIEIGKSSSEIEPLRWNKGQGARQSAFLCYSSGTSGLPKGVMVSHRNVIANAMAIGASDRKQRQQMAKGATRSSNDDLTENVLGLLPMSHIYGLVVICHASIYQGDGVVVLPKFEFGSCMKAIQDHKIHQLYLVPPIIVAMTNNVDALKKFDLSHVSTVFSGAAPLGPETSEALQKMYPKWLIRQGYGLTETCTVVSSTSMQDIWYGSVGCLIPRVQARLVTAEGVDVTEYDQPGELWVKSPSVVLGYLHNDEANKATFTDDGYMRTGDEAVFRKSPHSGSEHLFIVDRIKELIKVKGMQVAPAELEAHLLSHHAVADTTVIPIPDASAGERPKAFIVKSAQAGGLEDSERLLKREIMKHVEANKARHKWLKEIEFVDVIPKSPSGKILRRLMRDREKEARRKKGAKL